MSHASGSDSAEFRQTLIGKGVAGRARVSELAAYDETAALQLARAIEHPWYRCQALSYIVETNRPHPQAIEILNEALTAAYSQSEPNRVASVARWPLQLLVCYSPEAAEVHVESLLEVISAEPHVLRRLDGIRAILLAVVPDAKLRERVLTPFFNTAKESKGWRTEKIVDLVATVLAEYDRESAARLLQSREVTRHTRNSRALLSRFEVLSTTATP